MHLEKCLPNFLECVWLKQRMFIVRVTTLSTESRTVSMFTRLAVVNRP